MGDYSQGSAVAGAGTKEEEVTPGVYQRPAARRDLVEHFVYLAENAGLATADKFLVNAEESFADLTKQPSMGAPLMLRQPELAGMRKWRVKEFEKFLIFYLPRRDSVSIVRVLHAAEDWWRLLGITWDETPERLLRIPHPRK